LRDRRPRVAVIFGGRSPDQAVRCGATGRPFDCQGIDAACANTSWQSDAHRLESGVTAGALLLTPLILAFAFRAIDAWRPVWLVTLLATPSSIVTSALFSALGNGAASRAGSVVWFVWLAFVALHLLRVASDERQMTAPAAAPRRS